MAGHLESLIVQLEAVDQNLREIEALDKQNLTDRQINQAKRIELINKIRAALPHDVLVNPSKPEDGVIHYPPGVRASRRDDPFGPL